MPRKERSSGNSRSPSQDGTLRENNSSKSSDFSSNAEGAAGTESLSIDETNKLRAKLGLAPLECDDAPKQTTKTVDGKSQTVLADGVVWAPASSLTAEKKSEKIREKLAILKETRELERSRMKHKQLIADDDDDDDASSWVQRSRKLEKRKLEEKIEEQKMDAVSEEFGVDNLLKEEASSRKSQYSSTSLGGLKVEHSVDRFVEGEATILTLKDKKILDEDDEDVLVNVNIVDHEKYQRNVENKRKGADYQAFEEEFDEFGMPIMTSLLGKYDEVIDGENKRSFRIGLHGEIDDEEARYRQLVKKELESKTVSLKLPESKIASEYNTKEEDIAKFSKRKRKVKKVRSVLTADDLLKSMEDDPDKDRGSRMNGQREHTEAVDMDIDDFPPPLPMTSSSVRLDDDVKIDSHLQKTKMISESLTKKSDAAKSIAEKLRRAAAAIKEEPVEPKPKQLVFDNTAEFCRAVSELNKQEPVKKEPAESFSMKTQLDKELEDFAMRDVEDEDDARNDASGWDRVKEEIRAERENTQTISSSKLKSVLAEEPEVSTGVMGALLMARHKGYLEKEGGKRTMGPVTQNTSKTLPEYAIEDKSAKHIEDKWSRKEDRDKTSLREFKDTATYKPSFNLEYFDGTGRKLNEKEAFRELSHKFHGKGSGKLKTFKRMKKLEEERKLKGMASDDTPLHMVATMREKQKSLGAAFIVLSGAGQNLASSGTDFKK